MSIEGIIEFEKQSCPKVILDRERGLEFASSVMDQYSDIKDEEAIFMLALSLEHPEWKKELVEQVKKYKQHISDPEKILAKLRNDFSKIDSTATINDEAESWEQYVSIFEAQISEILEYFHPTDGEFPKKVLLVLAGNIIKNKNSGFSFHVDNTAVIVSHPGNVDNAGHEYLHGIINPLTEMIANDLPKENIISLASVKYKVDEGYGEHAESLLNEELIRTYNDIIRHGEDLPSLEQFKQVLDELTEESYANTLNSEPETRARLEQMGIHSLLELRGQIDTYFDRYVRNDLRERVYSFYKEYEQQKITNRNIRFKDFFKENIRKFLMIETHPS